MPNSSPFYLEVEDIFAIGAEQQSRRKSSAKEPLSYTNRAITSFMESVVKMNEAVLVPSKLRDIEVRECDATNMMPVNSDLYSFFQMLNTVRQDLFSNSKYHSAFLVANGNPSGNNSGQNSGRVTPTGSLSRRASTNGMYGQGGSPASTPTSPMSNGNGRTLMPPNTLSFERKLSSSCSLSSDLSPDLMSNSTHSNGNGITNGNSLLSPNSILSPGSISPVPLGLGSRSTSLSSLLAAVSLDSDQSEVCSSEERVQQITSCFAHHLSALYTILGHFSRSANYITRRYQEETEGLF